MTTRIYSQSNLLAADDTAAEQEAKGKEVGLVHLQYLVPSSPGTNEVITAYAVNSIRGIVSSRITDVNGYNVKDQDAKYVVSGRTITVSNGTSFSLAQSQTIDLLIAAGD